MKFTFDLHNQLSYDLFTYVHKKTYELCFLLQWVLSSLSYSSRRLSSRNIPNCSTSCRNSSCSVLVDQCLSSFAPRVHSFLFFFGGFPENGPEELMFGCICGNPKSLANPREATGLFITIKKKYVSININMINLIYVYLFVYVLVCTYQLRKTYLDLPMAVQILRWFLVVVVVALPS
jgi:hypothetical protein